MKVSLQRDEFSKAFTIAQNVAPARSPKPILQNVKFEANANGGQLLATDLEIGVRVQVDGLEIMESGTTVLPVARFNQVLREAPGELKLEITGNSAVVTGQRFKVKLTTESPEEFPSISEFKEERYHVIEARLLRGIIKRTIFATDNESSRYALGGVLLEMSEDKIVAVGTDGRRLAKMEGPAKAVKGHQTTESNVIVPSRALQLIDRAIGDEGEVKIAVRGNDILINTEKLTLFTRMVEGRFPRWRDVIPTRPNASRIPMQAGLLQKAIQQAMIVTSEESRGVDFDFTRGQLELKANTAQVGETEVTLEVPYDGNELKIVLDPRYVIDFLKVLSPDATVTLEIQDGGGPAVMTTDDGYTYIIMPLSRDR
jgi:DNA polymerase-3 subunit beta